MIRNIVSLVLFVFFLGTSFSSLALAPEFRPPRMKKELTEGFDKESPEKIEKARLKIERLFQDAVEPQFLSASEKVSILNQYQHLDPRNEVPSDLLEQAVLYFEKNKGKFPNKNYLTIIDFKPRSDQYRFFLIHLPTGAVEKYHTTHGTGSDQNEDGIAERFLNVPNSKASSVGFARTAEIYSGAFKRSMRLDGLSTTNSKMRERAIVVHGWDYAYEANVIQGMSWGCPALDWKVKDQILDKIKGGSLFYIGVSGT